MLALKRGDREAAERVSNSETFIQNKPNPKLVKLTFLPNNLEFNAF